MLKITKFKAQPTYSTNRFKTHRGAVEVQKNGETKTIKLPVFSNSTSLANSKARAWRNIDGNMERIEAAFDAGKNSVPGNKKPA